MTNHEKHEKHEKSQKPGFLGESESQKPETLGKSENIEEEQAENVRAFREFRGEEDFLVIKTPLEIKLCDPACGSGHMLNRERQNE